jgi:chromosome segregation ATPase
MSRSFGKYSISAVGLLALMFGWSWVKSHWVAARDEVKGIFESATPDAYEFARLRALLVQDRKEVAALRADLAENAARAASAADGVERLEREVEDQSRILRQAGEALATSNAEFRIGGRAYARDEVEADARVRASSLNDFKRQLEAQRHVVAELKSAVKQSELAVARALEGVRSREGELESLQVRLANARLPRRPVIWHKRSKCTG